jgi:hypothetical protein
MSTSPRRRGRMAVISFMLMLLVTAKRAEHHPGPDGAGPNGLESSLAAVPEILSELAQFLGALTKR